MAKEEIRAKLHRAPKRSRNMYEKPHEETKSKRVSEREKNESRHHRITGYQKSLIDWITDNKNGGYLYHLLEDVAAGKVRNTPEDLYKINKFMSLLHQAKEKPKRGRPRNIPDLL